MPKGLRTDWLSADNKEEEDNEDEDRLKLEALFT